MTYEGFANSPVLTEIIRLALSEDIGAGDHTTLSTIPENAESRARCLIKDTGILAGVEAARHVFRQVDPELQFEQLLNDGQRVTPGEIAFTVHGRSRSILIGERLALNIMQRMSGIATVTRSAVDLLEGLPCRILDTRKTTPVVRHLEKWAVLIGGGTNHRTGLYDMILIKDNHIFYAGGIEKAIHLANAYLVTHGLQMPVEVETRTLDEVDEAIRTGGIQRIMLDNMTIEDMREAVRRIGGKYETEASGNITPANLREKAATGVDFVSMGWLTHSVRSLDISLKGY